jgi:hypothetical protein
MTRGEKRPVTMHLVARYVGLSSSVVSTVPANRHEEQRLRAHDRDFQQVEIGIRSPFVGPLFSTNFSLS